MAAPPPTRVREEKEGDDVRVNLMPAYDEPVFRQPDPAPATLDDDDDDGGTDEPQPRPFPESDTEPEPVPRAKSLRGSAARRGPTRYDSSYGDFANPERVKDRIEDDDDDSIGSVTSPFRRSPVGQKYDDRFDDDAFGWNGTHLPQPPEAWPEYYEHPSPPRVDPEEEARRLRLRKDELLGKIDFHRRRGHDIPKNYNHTSDVIEMESVVNRCDDSDRRKSGLMISQKLLIGFTGLVEWLNHEYDPIGAKLDNWSSEVHANVHDFDSVLMRCWERYGRAVSDSNPLLELALALGLSGLTYHFTQSWVASQADSMKPAPPAPVAPPMPAAPAGGNPMSGFMGMMGSMMGGGGGGGGLGGFGGMGGGMPTMIPRAGPAAVPAVPTDASQSEASSSEGDERAISLEEESLVPRRQRRRRRPKTVTNDNAGGADE